MLKQDEDIIHTSRATSSIEFSPDNTKLYTHYTGNFFFQYDLSAGNAQSIIESEVQLTSENLKQGALQLGPDGKIYCATDLYYLGVIHEPNNQGLACNFEHLSIYVGDDRFVGEGLPTFIQSYLMIRSIQQPSIASVSQPSLPSQPPMESTLCSGSLKTLATCLMILPLRLVHCILSLLPEPITPN